MVPATLLNLLKWSSCTILLRVVVLLLGWIGLGWLNQPAISIHIQPPNLACSSLTKVRAEVMPSGTTTVGMTIGTNDGSMAIDPTDGMARAKAAKIAGRGPLAAALAGRQYRPHSGIGK